MIVRIEVIFWIITRRLSRAVRHFSLVGPILLKKSRRSPMKLRQTRMLHSSLTQSSAQIPL